MEPETPTLCSAVSSGDVELISALLSKCTPEELDGMDNRGLTPLMCACGASGSSHIVRLLLKRGSNVNYAAPDSGMTALHTACKAGSSKLIHLFLDKGADPMARDNFGRTCLHWACLGGSISALKLLLSVTGDTLVNVQDASGYTPLMTAAEYGKEALVKALLESGASKSLQNKVTHVAFDLADWYGLKSIAELLSTADGAGLPNTATGAMSDGEGGAVTTATTTTTTTPVSDKTTGST